MSSLKWSTSTRIGATLSRARPQSVDAHGERHCGNDLRQSGAGCRNAGLTVTDVTKSDTGVNLANVTDPYMGRIELVEITPDSMHAKAIASFK